MAGEAGSSRRVAGIAVMLLAMLLFAGLDASNKYLSQSYAITQIMFLRSGVFCAFAVWLARRNLRLLARSRRPWMQIARSLVLVVEMAAFVLAVRYLPLAEVHAIAAVAPLMVTALSLPLLGERVSARQWAAVVAAFVGVLVIVRPGFASFDWIVVVPFGGAALWAFYQIMLRIAGRADAPETTVLYSAFVGLAATAPVGIGGWRDPTGLDWALFAASGLLGSAGHLAMTRAVVFCPPAVLQPFGYTLLLWAALLGLLLFDQFPDLWTIVGAAIVTASGLYAWLAERATRDGGRQP